MMIRSLFALLALVFVSAPGAARAQEDGAWLRAESANFIVYSRGRERTLRDAVQKLESFDALARTVTRAPTPPASAKLTVFLLRDRDALTEARAGLPESTRGFYMATPDLVAAYAVQDDAGWDGEAQLVLFHEYAHHFMRQYFPQPYPAWYVEGFAEYFSTVEFARTSIQIGRPSGARGLALLMERSLPMRTLLAPPENMSDQDRNMFYAQSWLFTHYIMSDPARGQQAQAYFEAIREGADPIEAFEPAFGVSPEETERLLRSYLRGGFTYMRYNNRELDDVEITVTRMPRSADALLLSYARLRQGHSAEEEAATMAAAVLEEAARFPGDVFAARVAAYAETERDPVHARELLAPALQATPDDPETLFLLGRTYAEEARLPDADRATAIREARRAFVASFRADPNSVPTLYEYASTYSGERLPPNVLDVLVHAHLLAPQVSEIRFNAAIQLMSAGRREEAEILLRPLLYDPHNPQAAERVRRLLDGLDDVFSPGDPEDEAAPASQ